MTIQVRCDVGGEIEETDGAVLTTPRLFGMESRLKLPEGWRYVDIPLPKGDWRPRVVCPECMMRVWRLFGLLDGDEPTVSCVRCPHSAFKHRGSRGCQVCDCELSEAESTDPGWAQS